MDLDLTPEQRAFRDEVRTFIREKLPSEIRERLRAGHPPRKQDTVACSASSTSVAGPRRTGPSATAAPTSARWNA